MSTINKRKSYLNILIPFVLLIVISTVVYVFQNQIKEVDENNDSTFKTDEQNMNELKERLFALIPNNYEVIESEYENYPYVGEDGCISIYIIYSKEYSELEKEYFDPAYITYCRDINTASLGSQVGEVRYDSNEDSWFYTEGDSRILQEKKTFGTNIVTISEAWGSHHSWDAYILRVDDSDEVVMLLIPQATRIRCEIYDEDGVEIWKEECVEFLDSLDVESAGNAWVFNDRYDQYYEELLEILSQI